MFKFSFQFAVATLIGLVLGCLRIFLHSYVGTFSVFYSARVGTRCLSRSCPCCGEESMKWWGAVQVPDGQAAADCGSAAAEAHEEAWAL